MVDIGLGYTKLDDIGNDGYKFVLTRGYDWPELICSTTSLHNLTSYLLTYILIEYIIDYRYFQFSFMN